MNNANTVADTNAKKGRWRVTRRGFLIGLGATGAGLAVGIAVGQRPFYRFMAGLLDNTVPPGDITNEPLAWFEVLPDNRVAIYISKVEMGQGIHTALAQIGAEELGVRWDQVAVRQASTSKGPPDSFGTGGSGSVVIVYEPLRQAAAMMRTMLVQKASEKMEVPTADLVAQEAAVQAKNDPNQRMTYADIVAGVTAWPEIDPDTISLKPTSDFKLIGKSLPRVDFEKKLTGQAIYGYDVHVEGMLYGAVARRPTIGAKMVSASAGNAKTRPGVVDVVIDLESEFAGVVAKTRQQAIAGVRALQIEWDEGKLWQQAELEAMLNFENKREGYTIQKDGNAPRVIGDAPSFTAEYFTPFAIHAHLEPQAAMVHVKPDGSGVTVFGSTQGQATVQGELAELLNMDEALIDVTPTYLGGGFGRRLNIEAAVEAARLSRAVGVPVHVGWTRPEDMRDGYFRPATRSVLSAKLANGRIEAIQHKHSSGSVAFPFFPGFLQTIFGTDFGSWRGAFNHYHAIENRDLTTWLVDFPVKTGWWRGLGLLANVFATESFMDELAYEAGADPLQFRLDHLGTDLFSERMRGVLEAAAKRAGWGETRPDGRALGIACSTDVDTVVAQVAEVSLDEATGQIRVHKVVSAVDAGLFINPNGATAQTEGAVVMGLSSTLIEEMQVKDGRVNVDNFGRYPLITMDMSPDMEVVLLESDGVPRGMGEPPIGPIAAAVGNAFFALTGTRLRRLPFKPDYVKAQLVSSR